MTDIIEEPEEEGVGDKKKEKRKGNYVNANYKILELTEEQKAFIQANYDKMPIAELAQKAFNNPDIDGHYTEAKSIKAYIATFAEGFKPKTTADKPRKGPYVLTPEQQTSVQALLNSENPPTVKEMFKLHFPDIRDFSPLCAEYQSLSRFVKSINEEAMDIWEEPVDSRRYKPPRNYATVLGLVNRYVHNPQDPSKMLYDMNNIKPQHERNLKALGSYMQTTKFVLQASQYDRKADRDLFESTFVRQVQDKATDLLPEEVDTYISIAAETVTGAQIEREIIKQQKKVSECQDGDDDEGGNKAKLAMSLVEYIGDLRDKHKESKKQAQSLITSVSGSRAKRIDSKSNQNDCLANLIGLWIEEKSRGDLLALAKKEHREDEAEFSRIESLDDTYALIAGMTKDEAIHGV